LVKPEAKDDMRKVLLGLVEKKAEGQRETIEGQIIAAIDDVAEFEGAGQIIIPTGVVLRAVNFGKSERYEMSPQRLGKRLQSLGLHTEISGGYSNLYVSESELALLKEQYGLIECSEISADSNDNEADPDADDDSSMRVVESVESAGTVPPLNVGCDAELAVAC
jgi:hypothetical protein